MKLFDFLPRHNKITIAISGLNKNSGKTVVLNCLLRDAVAFSKIVAITSIGYDGEKTDMLDGHQKPQICISSGTIVATASSIIEKAKQDIEIIKATGQFTPLGEVYIVRYHQNAYTEIVGPSSLQGLIKVKLMMDDLAEIVIIDGALNRISQISPRLCDAAYFAVGGQGNINEIVDKAKQQLSLIGMPLAPPEIRESARQMLLENKCAIISQQGESVILSCSQVLQSGVSKTSLVIYRGALTFSIAKILQSRYGGIVVSDISSVFITPKQLKTLTQKGFPIYVGWSLPLVAVTLNPKRITGQTLNIRELGSRISALCPSLPVVDVISSLCFKGGEYIGRLE